MTGIRPWRMERDTVSPTASIAPTKAKAGSKSTLDAPAPRPMASTAPTDAPLDTPMMPGSASGLLKIPWSTAPDMPSPAPTIRPTSVRGKRMCRRTASCSGVRTIWGRMGNPMACAKYATMYSALMSYCPEHRDRMTTAASAPTSPAKKTRCFIVSSSPLPKFRGSRGGVLLSLCGFHLPPYRPPCDASADSR